MRLDLRVYVLLVGWCAALAGAAQAGTTLWWGSTDGQPMQLAGPPTPPTVVVPEHDLNGIRLTAHIRGVELALDQRVEGDFTRVTGPGMPLAGAVGAPALPVLRRLIAVPTGAQWVIQTRASEPAFTALSDLGLPARVRPLLPTVATGQPDEPGREVFTLDESAYAQRGFAPAEAVSVTEAGISGGVRLALVEIRPVAYDAATGTLALWSDLEVAIAFEGGQWTGRALPVGMQQVVLNPPTAPRGAGTKLLIVTIPAYASSAPLTQFVNAKTTQGFSVTVHNVTPGTNGNGIKSYIQSLWGTANEPDYVLFVGDAQYNTWQASDYNLPCYPTPRGARTDAWFVCMDGPSDWMPDIPIGRLAIPDVAALQVLVDKTLYVEGGQFSDPGYAQHAAFIAGPEVYTDAENLHNYVIDTHMTPAGVQSDKLYYATYGARTEDVAAALNDGRFLTAYFGHANGFQAWSAPAFVFNDIDALTNQGLYPCIVSFACSTTAFHYTDPTQNPGFIEKFMLVPDKGAVAGWGPSWSLEPYTFGHWGTHYKAFMRAVYQDGVREIGDAALAAHGYFLTHYGASDPVTYDMIAEAVLLGDPTLHLPEPQAQAENYLIVTPPDYVNSLPLNKFVTHRTATGYNVSTYTVPVGTSKETLRAYIQSLWGTSAAPKYVLLIGDAATSTSTANTLPFWVGIGSKHAASDLYYGCMGAGDDWYPEIPVGRFPVKTVAQLDIVVDKTIKVESGAFANPEYPSRVVFSVNADTYNTGEPTAEAIITDYLLPNNYTPIRIYQANGGSTADVAAAVNNGCVMIAYMGHSDSTGWWNPSFRQANVRALTNNGLYPLAFGWSCNTSHFDNDECFGETWVREANKGAAAYISASNYIYWGSASAWAPSGILERAFFASFFERDQWNIGPAWQSALYSFLDDFGQPTTPGGPPTQNADIIRNFFEEFVTLGDPALRLPQPNGFRVAATPDAQSICTTTTPTAIYTVSVQKIGAFAAPVNLTVTGAPAGVTAALTANNLPPPFTSTLTLTGLGGASPGTYNLTITGTAGTSVQTAVGSLSLSSAGPGTPTLTSPANGQTNVARKPTLSWAAATQAATYEVEVATNSNFTTPVYSKVVTSPSVALDVNLEPATTHYWRVRAHNGCGVGGYSTTFSFTVIAQADYFTEQFTGATGDSVDLDNKTIRFIPNGSGNYYRLCGEAATALPTNPAGGTTITSWTGSTDDGYKQVTLTGGQTVSLYGQTYASFFIGTNGYITFTAGDTDWQESLADHFATPRVSALFDDLHPGNGGSISWKQLADRVAISYQGVPEVTVGGANTFQIELFTNGEIHITYLAVSCNDAIVGLSAGGGQPSDFVETDLSASGPCAVPGACCIGQTCDVRLAVACTQAGGVFQGDNTDCTPDPCLTYEPGCVIISEVVDGTLSGGCPKWIELTNTGTGPFAFFEGGIIVQSDNSTDTQVDIDLTGAVIAAGASFVIVSNQGLTCTGSFDGIYNMTADFYTNVLIGNGNDRYILTDTANGAHLLDIYGEFGVNGTGLPWEYTSGYSYRMPNCNQGYGTTFAAGEWFFGGKNSLVGTNPEWLLQTLTTPGTHEFAHTCSMTIVFGDMNCDGVVTFADINPFVAALGGAAAYHTQYPWCHWMNADCNNDGVVDFRDINPFVATLGGGN